jgi:hypothetical protein
LQPVSATTKEVEGEVGASVVHSPWNAPPGFLTPMVENLDEIQPSGAAYATESSFLRSRTLSCVPDEQLSESLSVKNYAAATDVEENYNGSDPGPETEYGSDVALISALDMFYTFLGYLTQRQLQLVCGKFELSKCGTKEKLTRSILRRLNTILDGVVRDRKDQGQMQDLTDKNSEIEQIAKRVDVVCKVSKSQQVPCTFREFSHYCLSRTSSGPVVCVKRCKLSNNFKGRDVVGTSRGMST